jgi:hypothetical protein
MFKIFSVTFLYAAYTIPYISYIMLTEDNGGVPN